MGVTYNFKEDNKIFINTEFLNIELSQLKHLIDSDSLLIYIYGTSSNHTKDLVTLRYNIADENGIEVYSLLQNKADIFSITPCKKSFSDLIAVNDSTGIYLVSNYLTREGQILSINTSSIYKKILWSEMNENILIGTSSANQIEIFDLNTDKLGSYSCGKSLTDKTEFPDKLILDVQLIEKSPFTNCIYISLSDGSLIIYDYSNKVIVDKVKIPAPVKNISLNTSCSRVSCTEVSRSATYLFDLR